MFETIFLRVVFNHEQLRLDWLDLHVNRSKEKV